MIDLAPVLKVMPLFTVALIAPGPDFMLISTLALARGRLAGVAGAAGIALGNLVYMVLCLFGLGIVFATMHWLVTLIRICGGLYLVYLGLQLWRASFAAASQAQMLPGRVKNRNPFVLGFLTNLTNPKAMAFFTSVFALALSSSTDRGTELAIVGAMVSIAFCWFSLVAVGLSVPAMRQVYMRLSRWIDRVSGTVLALFGLRLMFSAKN
ncbi:MAG: LysE family transporter [Pseudomonadota bacterium]|nr:LysE family transporter [Pseudomonadota bacterium]